MDNVMIFLMLYSFVKLYDGFQLEQELGSNYYYKFQSLSREWSVKGNITKKSYREQK